MTPVAVAGAARLMPAVAGAVFAAHMAELEAAPQTAAQEATPRTAAQGAVPAAAQEAALSPGQAIVPPIDQESVAAGEADATRTITAKIEQIVNAAHTGGERPVRRDAHAKGHGCVKAEFSVVPDLSSELRQGVFAEPYVFSAWIRFSNGNGTPHDDHTGDGRGMAIKLTCVAGPKILDDEMDATTQDFVMINYPVFFVRNAADYVTFTELSGAGKAGEFFKSRPHEADISNAITSRTVDQVLEQRYFSMTPYLLGRRYMKFSAAPVACGSGAAIKPSTAPAPVGDPDYLRNRLKAVLGEKDACFDFAVQLQTDSATMPVEDPTIEWHEGKAPFVKVASIRIPRQQFDSAAQQMFCENLSLTPWHALATQRPAGGINRIRKIVYQAVSKLRHELNGAPRAEPTGNETFE